MALPNGPYGRAGRANMPAMVQSPNGLRGSFLAGNKRTNPFPTDLGGVAGNGMKRFRGGIPALAKRQGRFANGSGNMPRFGDQSSESTYARMNIRVFYHPQWNGRDVGFVHSDYLFIVRSSDTEAQDAHMDRTAYTSFCVATMRDLAEAWREGHEWRETVMANGLVEPTSPEYADYSGGRFEPELIPLDDARSDNPLWATTMEEVDYNFVPLGPFVSSDIAGTKAAAAGYFANPNADPLLSCTAQGNYDGHANVFGVAAASSVFVGYIVKKRQAFSENRTGSLLDEDREPLEFIPYSSRVQPRPFVASDSTEYDAFLAEFKLWTGVRRIRDRSNPRSDNDLLSEWVAKARIPPGSEYVGLTINQANIGRKPMSFLQPKSSIIRSINGSTSEWGDHMSIDADMSDTHYTDLGYEDVEMYRDSRTRQIRAMPTFETGRYIRLGFAESNEKGTGLQYSQADLTNMLNKPANKNDFVRLGGESTVRVRVGVM